MTTPRQRVFILGQLAWMLSTTAVLASIGQLTVEKAFVGSFVGLVMLTALTTPAYASAAWRRRLRLPLYLGTLVFLGFVGLRTAEKFVGSL